MQTLPSTHQPERLFTRFETNIDGFALPNAFTFPFYYQPHPLCELAASQLQAHLTSQTDWQHNFGLDGQLEGASGKMFGVLLVKNSHGEIGYLSAFSGKIDDSNWLPGFVPPVYDMLRDDGFFRSDLSVISDINHQVSELSQDPTLLRLEQQLLQLQQEYQHAEQAQRDKMIAERASRKQARQHAEQTLQGEALSIELDRLAKASVAEKNVLKYLKLDWEQRISETELERNALRDRLNALKEERKTRSNALQHKLFGQYRFLNALGQARDLNAIFAPTTNPTPPAGSGECAAPKLLHYAFQHHLTPLAIAEFWWGVSPKSEIRQHGQFYPACNSKCQPILGHMLQGLSVDPNPLETPWAQDLPLEIVYQDDAMVVVNKPSGLLSVPGKTIQDSAYQRLVDQFPDAEGVFVIHRLDMATSGLLVFALSRRANKQLQKQFIARTAKKRYVARLDGVVNDTHGEITLPMRGDPIDRPRQLVCFEHGKPAHTSWELRRVEHGQSELYLYPHTGRTHQLRVHCAHHLGLNMPMVGDGLYGNKGKRLCLHAERLIIEHPYSKALMTFQVDVDFDQPKTQ